MKLILNIFLKIFFLKIAESESVCSENWYCPLSTESKHITESENGLCECKCCQSLILNICSSCLINGQINLVSESDCHDVACNFLCNQMTSCESTCRYDNESECFFSDLVCRIFDSNFVFKKEYSNYRTVCGKIKLLHTEKDYTSSPQTSIASLPSTQEETKSVDNLSSTQLVTASTENSQIANPFKVPFNCSNENNKTNFLLVIFFLVFGYNI